MHVGSRGQPRPACAARLASGSAAFVASLASNFVLLISPLRLDERPQLIVEREMQVAEAAGFPELHLPDSKLGQAILRAVAADDDPKLRLVGPSRTVRDVVEGDLVAVLR